LVLVVDDLHWADGTTVAWLDYVLARLGDAPLLLVATYRPEDAVGLGSVVAGWERRGVGHRLPLGQLSTTEGRALVAALGGDPALAARCTPAARATRTSSPSSSASSTEPPRSGSRWCWPT
jgi:predicted ATPase